MTTTNDWTRVVVLTPPPPAGRGLTDGLKKEFAARDWFAIEQHDPHLALAELCLRERAQVARSAWGLQRMELIALVVMQPDHWRDLDDLVEAVSQFVPSATIWSIADDETVEPLNGAPPTVERPRPESPAQPPDAITSKSALSNVNLPSTDIDDLASVVSRAKSQRISREEIDMLLEMESSEVSAGEDRS